MQLSGEGTIHEGLYTFLGFAIVGAVIGAIIGLFVGLSNMDDPSTTVGLFIGTYAMIGMWVGILLLFAVIVLNAVGSVFKNG